MVDAARDGHAPGTVSRLSPAFGPGYPPPLLPHDIGLKNLLDVLIVLDKKVEVTLFTISLGESDRITLDLSPEVERGVREAASQITDFLLAVRR